jgi:hypothetical protein
MKYVPIVDWNRGIVFVNPEFVQAVAANGAGALITMRDYIVIAKDTPDAVIAKLEGFVAN